MMFGCGWKHKARVVNMPRMTMQGWVYDIKVVSKSFYIFGFKVFTVKTNRL